VQIDADILLHGRPPLRGLERDVEHTAILCRSSVDGLFI
jgi:hypothetical protein